MPPSAITIVVLISRMKIHPVPAELSFKQGSTFFCIAPNTRGTGVETCCIRTSSSHSLRITLVLLRFGLTQTLTLLEVTGNVCGPESSPPAPEVGSQGVNCHRRKLLASGLAGTGATALETFSPLLNLPDGSFVLRLGAAQSLFLRLLGVRI